MTKQEIDYITRKITKEFEGVDLKMEYKAGRVEYSLSDKQALESSLNLSAWIQKFNLEDIKTERELRLTVLNMIAAEMDFIEAKIKAMRDIHKDITKELIG